MSPTTGGRRRLIRKLLTEGAITSQADLVELLEAEGFPVTQATVSRDLDAIGATRIRTESGARYELRADGGADHRHQVFLVGPHRPVVPVDPHRPVFLVDLLRQVEDLGLAHLAVVVDPPGHHPGLPGEPLHEPAHGDQRAFAWSVAIMRAMAGVAGPPRVGA